MRDGVFKGVPITGVLGDQQAASLGHGNLEEGDTKTTYGKIILLIYKLLDLLIYNLII